MKPYDKTLGYPKTVEDIQKFIDEYEVENMKDLENHGLFGLCQYIKKNKFSSLLNFPKAKTPKNKDIVMIKSLEDFQKFIDSNSIKSASDFSRRFPGGYIKLIKMKLTSNVIYPNPYDKYKGFDKLSFDEIQKLVLDNKCVSLQDVGGKVSHCLKNYILSNNDILKNLQFSPRQNRAMPSLETLDDFQKFIDARSDEIPTITSLHDKFNPIYRKALKKGIIRELMFKVPVKGISWGHVNSLEDVLREIQIRKIPTASILSTEYPGLYKKIQKLGINYNEIVYYSDNELSGFDSSWEKKFFDFLSENTKYKISHHIRIDNLKDYHKLEMDLEVTDSSGKVVYIEIEGPTHFVGIFGDKQKSRFLARKHDIMKQRWSKENNIPVLLFSYLSKDYIESVGFPYYIYTNEKSILEEINNIFKNDSE